MTDFKLLVVRIFVTDWPRALRLFQFDGLGVGRSADWSGLAVAYSAP